MTIGLYVIHCSANGKSYVGRSVNIEGRLASHLSMLRRSRHTNKHLLNSWVKHGESCFTLRIALVCDLKSCAIYEDLFISSGLFEFNIITSSSEPPLLNPEVRAKHLIATTSKEFRQARSLSMSNRLKTEEGIDQLCKARALCNTDEARKANSNFHRSWASTQERRGHLITQASAGGVAAAIKSRKPIMCVETQEVFESIKSAARHLITTGVTKNEKCWANIQQATTGTKPHAYGFHWKLLDRIPNA